MEKPHMGNCFRFKDFNENFKWEVSFPRPWQRAGTDLVADVFLCCPSALHDLLPLVSSPDLSSLATVLLVLDSRLS